MVLTVLIFCTEIVLPVLLFCTEIVLPVLLFCTEMVLTVLLFCTEMVLTIPAGGLRPTAPSFCSTRRKGRKWMSFSLTVITLTVGACFFNTKIKSSSI